MCGEFTGSRWIPRTKASDAGFDAFFDLRLNKWLSKNREAGDMRSHRAHYGVIVMIAFDVSEFQHCFYGMSVLDRSVRTTFIN